MGALYGADTCDADKYGSVMEDVLKSGLNVELVETKEPEVQRIWIKAAERDAMVDALNRGGGRLALINASPSVEEAKKAASSLGIELVA